MMSSPDLANSNPNAESHQGHHAAAHSHGLEAPIGVMGGHTHPAGTWMVSYRYMNMQMQGSRIDTDRIEDEAVVDPNEFGFRLTPTEMPMQMHMFGLMHAPSNRVTFMAMVNVISNSMDHLTRAGGTFTTQASGLGDTKVQALVVLTHSNTCQIHLNAGLSLPTGSITESDVTPMSAPDEAQLPYPMQLGSGTFDPEIGLTYLGQSDHWGWGAQGKATFRLGKNDNDYSIGNRGLFTAWGARGFGKNLSLSVRALGSAWGNIGGSDSAYNTAVMMQMVPTVFADLRGGERIDVGLGGDFTVHEGALNSLRIAIEALLPVYQRLDGPQLETDSSIIVGVQYAF
ncbi:MAG: transporter [Candidatus Eisenbacteria bacterium]|uniref:Transporter n=1 Tax=Eiseniibacteriota bacterium TaxID=2212470 RepID=A0A7Y2H2H0_UNCEI|nr:transporter [Candidatus Eisenbacteria bacterium]